MKLLIFSFSIFVVLTITISTNKAHCGRLNAKNGRPYVKTRLGGVRGSYNVSYKGRRYASFRGVPYALPPIGDRRFEPPQPILNRWTGNIDAFNLPVACMQYNALFNQNIGEEDCLYLNIYVPITARKSLPVLFWLHGGGFQYGYSSSYRAKYLMDRDLILVTVNYRVGLFGFLSTGDEVVPGNMGLKDQNLALRWVNENIEYFGGDPKKITLTGVSAGGASVHYHYLSPMSRGLFRNGISFSGTALSSWAQAENTTELTKTLARAVNCPTTHFREMIDCLKKASAKDLFGVMLSFWKELPFSYALFPPVVENLTDNYFINKSPTDVIRDGEAYDAPWVAGVVEEDGLFMTAGFALNETIVKNVIDNWSFYGAYALHYENRKKPKSEYRELANVTKQHYFVGTSAFSATELNFARNLTRLIGDEMIASPAATAAKLQAKANESPVWFYYYTYRAAQSLTDTWSNSTFDFGVAHDDDIYLVLENNFIDPTTTRRDRAMLEEMLDFWHSVADKGQPDLGVTWTALNEKHFEYMHIAGPGDYRMEMDDDFRDTKFWNRLGL